MTAWVERVERNHHLRVAESLVGAGLVAGIPLIDEVVGLAFLLVPDQHGVRCQCSFRVDQHRQWLVVDENQLERVVRDVWVFGNNGRDLLALEAHLVRGQHRLGVPGQCRHPGQIVRGHGLAGDDRDNPRQRRCGGGVDRPDPGMCQRAAQQREVQHPRQHDVVEVLPLAADEPVVLPALDAVAEASDDRRLRCVSRHETVSFVGSVVRAPFIRRPLHGLDDVHVPGAAADVAGDGPPDVVLGGVGLAVEQRGGRQHHSGGAEAALQAVFLFETGLDRMQLAVARQPLDSGDFVPLGLHREHRAGLHR